MRRLLSIVGLIPLLAACGGASQSAAQPSGGVSSDASLSIAVGITPNSLDPLAVSGPDLNPTSVNMGEPPFTVNKDQQVVPYLADYKFSADGLTMTITVHKGITFHDGTALDAAAVKWNIERAKDPRTKAQQAIYYKPIKDMTVVDPNTLELHLSQPSPTLPLTMTTSAAALLSPKGADQAGNKYDAYTHPFGTGPFMLQEHVSGDHTTMVRYDKYWGNRPYYKTLKYLYVPEANTRESLLLAKQVDLVVQPPIADIDSLKSNKSVNLSLTPGDLGTIVSIDTQWPGLTDARVRQALNYAVDKKAAIQSVMHGAADELHAPVRETQFGSCNAGSYDYDPAKSKQLLQEAGASNLKVPMITPTGRYLQDFDTAQVVANYLRAVGVNATVDTMAWPQIIAAIVVPPEKQKYPLQVLGYGTTMPDASFTLEYFTKAYWAPKAVGMNFYTNPATEAAFAKQATTLDPASRRQQLCDLSKQVWQAAPWIFLWDPKVVIAYRSNLAGLDFQHGSVNQFVLTGMHPA